jgi:hypothetical protein
LVPLIGGTLMQFPFFSDSLSQWMDPLLRVLK